MFYDGPLGYRKRRQTLKTRDYGTALDRLAIWRQERAREAALGIRYVGVTLAYAEEKYLEHFEKRNKSVSVRRYRNALGHILDFVGRDLPIGALQSKDLQDYQLERIKVADKRTIDFEIDTLRAFLNWCATRKWIHENVASVGNVPRLYDPKKDSKKEKRIFTEKELSLLLEPTTGEYWQIPHIFSTLYYTGLRIGELGHLRTKDISLTKSEIQVRSKVMRIPIWDKRGEAHVVR